MATATWWEPYCNTNEEGSPAMFGQRERKFLSLWHRRGSVHARAKHRDMQAHDNRSANTTACAQHGRCATGAACATTPVPHS